MSRFCQYIPYLFFYSVLAEEYFSDPAKYEAKAKEYTQMYAMKKSWEALKVVSYNNILCECVKFTNQALYVC